MPKNLYDTPTMHQPSSSGSQKRKASLISDSSTSPGGESSKIPKGEYETGRVICEVCSEGISFRDESSGGFTLKHWDAHRLECSSPSHAPSDPVIYTPESTADALAHPPPRRRRAKRTEEERIDYLRSDPYVSKFEAYRVLCAACDKWIRLRPNSTYCSIPWDAHRKSCLAKRAPTVGATASEERDTFLSKDPDIRSFEAERILCNICDKWLTVHPDNHTDAMQRWISHRTTCQKANAGASSSRRSRTPPLHDVPPPSQQHMALVSSPIIQRAVRPAPDHLSISLPATTAPPSGSVPSSSSLAREFRAVDNHAPQESHHQTGENRAATLRADPLLREVEPDRVFCTLCQKWVQLRQDTSYCAYPWLQHRAKCLSKHHKMAQRSAEAAESRVRMHGRVLTDDETDWLADEGRSDGGMYASGSERRHSGITTPPSSRSRRPASSSADLLTPSGRLNFVFNSVSYLFATTYDASDDLTISSLLTYLNAAIPLDKYEDFDTAEVVRAAALLQERGDVSFKGDVLRLCA